MPLLLLRVARTWPLPGLGLLALPADATPHLLAHALHTALPVVAIGPDGTHHPATATVEEVTLPETPQSPVWGLLLDFGQHVSLVPGTEIWLNSSSADSPEPSLDTDFGHLQ